MNDDEPKTTEDSEDSSSTSQESEQPASDSTPDESVEAPQSEWFKRSLDTEPLDQDDE